MGQQGVELTNAAKKAMLNKLAKGKSIRAACAGICTVPTYYNTRDRLPEFADAADDAINAGLDLLESVVFEAVEVERDPKIALDVLGRRDPQNWGRIERLQHSGDGGGPLKFVVKLDDEQEDDEQEEPE